jgi:diacylglycerol kinase (ATP)
MRAVLILNPTSGISTVTTKAMSPEETEAAILGALRSYGVEPQVYYTTPEDTGQGLSTRAAADHADVVIAAGGDGTIHAVAKGLIGTQTVLGIIPTGTMNNLARSLGIPDTVEAACEVIAQGETRTIDVGDINGHAFLEVAVIGLEAELFPAAEEIKAPGLISTLHGLIEGLRTILAFKPPRLSISFDDRRRRPYQALQVTICNAPFYGPHFQVAPNVLMDDGLLDVVVYKNFSKFEFIQHGISITQGRRVYQPKITYRKVKSLRISTEQPIEIMVDGEIRGQTPALVRTIPAALSVRVPGLQAPGLHVEKKKVESSAKLQTSANLRK